jgi:hypothetical protein
MISVWNTRFTSVIVYPRMIDFICR